MMNFRKKAVLGLFALCLSANILEGADRLAIAAAGGPAVEVVWEPCGHYGACSTVNEYRDRFLEDEMLPGIPLGSTTPPPVDVEEDGDVVMPDNTRIQQLCDEILLNAALNRCVPLLQAIINDGVVIDGVRRYANINVRLPAHYMRMGHMSALDIAQDYGRDDLVGFLLNHGAFAMLGDE